MPNVDLFDSYYLQAATEEIVPLASFFKDRYFPTGADDIFAADKVLTEYRKGDRKLAAFVAPRVGAVSIERMGYEIREYQPAYIALSRLLTLDDLQKRGFGEALYPEMDKARRAARLQLRDLRDMDRRIGRREEWMAVQTMLNNACPMQEYIDAKTAGEELEVKFYSGASEHLYVTANKWNGTNGDRFADIKTMCRLLSRRGLPALDLVLGGEAAEDFANDEKVQRLLDNRRMEYGSLAPELTQYPGVASMGRLNFGGFVLNLFEVNESYEDENGKEQFYFPADGAMVTAPGCGHMMYGQITQIDYGSADHKSYAAPRVAKFILDQPNDSRSLRLACRPLAAPHNYCPYIFAPQVVG
jgi:GNAT superfamily N-acetyltransferase